MLNNECNLLSKSGGGILYKEIEYLKKTSRTALIEIPKRFLDLSGDSDFEITFSIAVVASYNFSMVLVLTDGISFSTDTFIGYTESERAVHFFDDGSHVYISTDSSAKKKVYSQKYGFYNCLVVSSGGSTYWYYEGISIPPSSWSSVQCPDYFSVLGHSSSEYKYSPVEATFYSLKHIRRSTGIALSNVVAVERISDGAIGVYDTVSETFILPEGTWTKGPYTGVEY